MQNLSLNKVCTIMLCIADFFPASSTAGICDCDLIFRPRGRRCWSVYGGPCCRGTTLSLKPCSFSLSTLCFWWRKLLINYCFLKNPKILLSSPALCCWKICLQLVEIRFKGGKIVRAENEWWLIHNCLGLQVHFS